MVHDVRIIRLGTDASAQPHRDMDNWMGDSICWWDGDTLVAKPLV